jgi:hypothetical protein
MSDFTAGLLVGNLIMGCWAIRLWLQVRYWKQLHGWAMEGWESSQNTWSAALRNARSAP